MGVTAVAAKAKSPFTFFGLLSYSSTSFPKRSGWRFRGQLLADEIIAIVLAAVEYALQGPQWETGSEWDGREDASKGLQGAPLGS